jgi:3-oxoacyl-[acyl-carrier-protein] synthase-3
MLYLHGIGHFHPENVIDNTFLEELDIGTDHNWILERVGIRTRRTVLSLDYIRETQNRDPRAADEASLYTNAQTGAKAANNALAAAGLKTEDIGMVIAGGCSPQWSIPATACTVAAELGIDAPCFDLSSACSTFAAQLHFLAQMADGAMPEHVLIVQPENNTRTVDYSDRAAAVLWGDATTAAIVSSKHPARARITKTTLKSDPKGWNKVRIPTGRHFAQEGSAVQGFAIRRGTTTARELAAACAGSRERLILVGHQANLLMLEGIARRAQMNDDRHMHNVQEFGNCGAAGAPSVISQRWQDFRDGDEVVVVVVGSGLTWGGVLIQFGDI